MNKANLTPQTKNADSMPPVHGILQRQCACGNHTPAGGECESCKNKRLGLQRKLTIGVSNDPLEQEADRVADQVMANSTTIGTTSVLPGIQRFSGQTREGVGEAPASVERVLSGVGRPLESTLRQDMETRFGHDFSNVRVHTGSGAEKSARDVNALAYTVGKNVVFGAGQFTPQSSAGKRLIVHELTHVVQQSTLNPIIQRLSDPDCDKTISLPMVGSCSSFIHTCNSETFIPTSSSALNISVDVDYVSPPGPGFGSEDFSVQVYKCGTLWDTKIGSKRLGPNIPGNLAFSIASVTPNDKYYLKIYSRSGLDLQASYRVAQ